MAGAVGPGVAVVPKRSKGLLTITPRSFVLAQPAKTRPVASKRVMGSNRFISGRLIFFAAIVKRKPGKDSWAAAVA